MSFCIFASSLTHFTCRSIPKKGYKVSQTSDTSLFYVFLVWQITSISKTSLSSRVVPTLTSMIAAPLDSTFSQMSFVSSSSIHRRLFQLNCWKEHWTEIGWNWNLGDFLLDDLSIITRSNSFFLTQDVGFTCSILQSVWFTWGKVQTREEFASPLPMILMCMLTNWTLDGSYIVICHSNEFSLTEDMVSIWRSPHLVCFTPYGWPLCVCPAHRTTAHNAHRTTGCWLTDTGV